MKYLSIILLALGLNASYATPTLNQPHAIQRNFHTEKGFQHMQRLQHKRILPKPRHYAHPLYQDRYTYHKSPHKQNLYRPLHQHAYKHSQRRWIRKYRHYRTPFYDNHGYFYGYFNRYGYYFENIFYRYDRYYTYQDRLRGRGLFDHTYYMPARMHQYPLAHIRHYNR